jgi:signal transduction histidine kinase
MSSSSSIGRKLAWLSVVSSGAALLAASLALLFFQLQQERSSGLRRLESLADLFAFNSAAAVDFNDPEAATAMLGALKMRPEIESAGILVNGRIFALYGQPTNVAASALGSGHQFTKHDLTVFRPISSSGRPLGTFFIRSNLTEIDDTWRRFAVITGAVAIPALLISLLIAGLRQRIISRPILSLAALAVAVSDRKDYSVRAPVKPSAAEIEQLVATFNQMLTEIQNQHEEIDRANALLEQRVADRTRELELRSKQLELQGYELAAANRELESFSYSVSHDLRAPLRAIDGFSQALLTDYRDKLLDQRGAHYLERVRAGTQRMSRLIDDLLNLARVTRASLERKDADVSAIAEDVAAELARRNPERTVHCTIEPGLRASADPRLLTIVFENLLGNAWKFTGNVEHAEVEVGRVKDSEELTFFVRDNGAGFDMAYADKLFGAFQRLHRDSEFEGTGIGLATVKRIVARHGGIVRATATPRAGATFYFTVGGKS